MKEIKKSGHGGNIREIADRAGLPEQAIIDFSASINPLGPPEYLRAAVSANLNTLLHYPDPDYKKFLHAVAEKISMSVEHILVGNGSTEHIFVLPAALPVKSVIIPSPSYIGYQEAMQNAGMDVSFLPLLEKDDFMLDWQKLTEFLSEPAMIFLGYPNNPTGKIFDLKKLRETALRFPQCYFVVDEAFIDFVQEAESAISLIAEGLTNIIVLRSMTKFYAIPGLRLGYAVASPEIALKIKNKLPPWSVNTLALALGEKFINDDGYFLKSKQEVVRLREIFTDLLSEIDALKVFKGEANYLLIKIKKSGIDANILAEKLLRQGIAIRVCDNFPGLGDKYFRAAVKSESENLQLVDALSQIFAVGKTRSRVRKKPAIMFQGTCSDAGKSILTAALCRIMLQDGVRVAPFKSQNMSLNSFVTMDGGEMGRAQVVQAQACRLDPDVRMNPVLLKPSSEVGSQVIVNGKPHGNMSVDQYVRFKPLAFREAQKAYDSLADDFDAIVLEGAGSPAEVNLKSHDIVNMRMAEYAKAPVLLVGDIDRGGVFASFVGTMEVLAEWERKMVAGFIVNRFRGQESLLADAFSYVNLHTGLPVLGVVPYLTELGLPEEDSVSFKKGLFDKGRPAGDCVEIALIDLPHISNFTDFEPFLAEPDVHLRVVKSPEQLSRPAAVILPGSKNVIKDLEYLKKSGLAKEICSLAENSETEIIGICGGFQMLGHEISDPYNIESSGRIEGLGLLPVSTVLEKNKTLTRQTLVHIESGETVIGYEIHHGQTPSGGEPIMKTSDGIAADSGTGSKLLWGTYLHGLFDADKFRHWFIDRLRKRLSFDAYKGVRKSYDLEPAFDRLAAEVRGRIDIDNIYKIMGL